MQPRCSDRSWAAARCLCILSLSRKGRRLPLTCSAPVRRSRRVSAPKANGRLAGETRKGSAARPQPQPQPQGGDQEAALAHYGPYPPFHPGTPRESLRPWLLPYHREQTRCAVIDRPTLTPGILVGLVGPRDIALGLPSA
ncbi:hypothetical protein KIL84_015787 [Mauremys mutica]|uniref:Uncharacterized protein n=1 Tax=Mauremys mutica TaxID=74926 RepID=A0A9D3WTR7_9SAUR|nr:hypothetical protein KIL84_015787 [Mauremys mutica]